MNFLNFSATVISIIAAFFSICASIKTFKAKKEAMDILKQIENNVTIDKHQTTANHGTNLGIIVGTSHGDFDVKS